MDIIVKVLGFLIAAFGIIGGLYVGVWLMFVQPILYACSCFDAGTLTATVVGVTVLECLFAGAAGGVIAYIGVFLGAIIADLL